MRLTIQMLHALGFDKSAPFGTQWSEGKIALGCSQCQAVAINGTPTHEHNCPNAVHECKGCNALVPVRVKYCDDCA